MYGEDMELCAAASKAGWGVRYEAGARVVHHLGASSRKDFARWIDRPWDRSQYKKPDEVAEAAVHALFADKPLRRYMVVPNKEEAGWTIGKQIEELVQLNAWQAYSFSREELIAMLDKAMAGEY